MAAEWKHKRYFRVRLSDSSLRTFTSTADANTKIGFTSVYSTSNPTKTEALEDSGQTLVVTYEFSSKADQDAFNNAIDALWSDSTTGYNPTHPSNTVEHFKTEWLHSDGTVSGTTDL